MQDKGFSIDCTSANAIKSRLKHLNRHGPLMESTNISEKKFNEAKICA